MQPTFRLEAPGRVDDVLQRLQRAIASPELAGRAESAGRCLDFKIEPEDRRFWSPHLGVQLDQIEVDGAAVTELHGRFGPRPEVWTLLMVVYFGAVCVMFFALIYGYAQWALGGLPRALVLVPASLLTVVGLHAGSLVGQRLSADQMRLLRSRFDRACEIAGVERA